MKFTIRNHILELYKKYNIDSAHDIYHLDRVYNLCKYISSNYNCNVNKDVLYISAYLHDLHRIDFHGSNKLKCSDDIENEFYEIYNKFNLPKDIVEEVKECIFSTDKHSFSKNICSFENLSVESQILMDADSLDALGAIGIARVFTYGEYLKEVIYNPEVERTDKEYDLTQLSPSIIHHFYEKLLKLESDMCTQIGKKMAKERTKYMQQYLNEFFKEWNLNE